MFQATGQQITETARLFSGIRFLHQGRDRNGVDCVGLLVAVARELGYPDIVDVEGYRRTPSADTIRETLRANCDEIPLESMKIGDIFLMRMGGLKPRHAAIYLSDEWNAATAKEPTLIHAIAPTVRIQPLSDFPSEWFVAGFRLRGRVD